MSRFALASAVKDLTGTVPATVPSLDQSVVVVALLSALAK